MTTPVHRDKASPKRHALVDVTSSHIAALGHHDGHLLVRFKDGGLYRYDKVPAEIYHAGLAASSVGSWFRAQVRGKFRHHELDA